MTAPAEVSAHRMATRIPGYVRPRPATVLGLSAPAWGALLSLAALVLVELSSRFELVSRVDLVPPTEMAQRAVSLLGDGAFVTDLLATVSLVATAFVLAGALGVVVAYVMWRWSWWRRALQPYLGVYYAVPVFTLYPIVVVLFGTGRVPIVLVAVAFSVVVVTTNSLIGFDAVPPTISKLARARRLTGRQYLTKVLLPAAVPDIASGLRLGLVYATLGVLGTEFILSDRGLGHFIAFAYENFRTADMYAGILLICLVALLLNITVAAVLNRMDWRRR